MRKGTKNDFLNLVRYPLGVGVVFGPENEITWVPLWGTKGDFGNQKA